MAVPVSPPELWDDQEFYPLHEEDDVPEIPFHRRQVGYLDDALRARFPDWLVTGNVCIYWERGNTRKYRAPDVFVVNEALTEPVHRVYQTWRQPPVLFAAEVGSRSTFRADEGPKQRIYQNLIRATEYLYTDPPRGDLRLWRQGRDGYEAVLPEPNGRLRSPALGLDFGLEGEFLRVYTPEGEPLRTHEESEQQLEGTEQRLEVTEQRLEVTEQRLMEADERATEEARRRSEAEARAAVESARREELERQLAELRARLTSDSA